MIWINGRDKREKNGHETSIVRALASVLPIEETQRKSKSIERSSGDGRESQNLNDI